MVFRNLLFIILTLTGARECSGTKKKYHTHGGCTYSQKKTPSFGNLNGMQIFLPKKQSQSILGAFLAQMVSTIALENRWEG